MKKYENTFRAALIAFALAGAMFLGGCNTVRGVGQDTQRAGEAIEDTATR